MSAFIANTPLVAMLAPRVTNWARRAGNPPSRYLMPLSYAVSFGGCITLIGTSTNLFVSDLMEDAGQRPVGLFEITPVGLPLAEASLRNLQGVFLAEAERNGQAVTPVGPDHRLEAGDRLTFAGNLDRLIDLQRIPGLVSAEERHFAPADGQSGRNFYEAVVGGSSELVDATLKEIGFRPPYAAAVVAIHRAGERINAKLGGVRLRPGDVLLVIGGKDFHQRYRDHHDFALIAPLRGGKPVRREHARVVELAILGLIVTAGTGLLDLLQVALVLAFGLVAFKVISASEARRAVDFDVIMLMGLSFGLASAVEASGLAKEIAHLLVQVSEPLGDLGILAGILITTMIMTELLSNNAAAALMFPIAMATAEQSGLEPRPFAMMILFGATLSFLTPIGYQSNTLVWSMGGSATATSPDSARPHPGRHGGHGPACPGILPAPLVVSSPSTLPSRGGPMTNAQSDQRSNPSNGVEEFDAVVVGAGFSGLYMLHRLRDTLGLSARVFEAADDVGGTWYWNRYPGARCDSESYFYSFSDRLSEDLLQEWTWSERFAAQPEILSYLQTVADRFDLRKDIRFGTRVVAAEYDEASNRWMIRTDAGGQVTARFLITAVGCLSSTNLPDFPGRESFGGESYHTGLWPHEGVDFTGKRVAVIGTGATAVQAIPEIAKEAAHVYVLQRTPNYDLAGGNRPMDAEDGRKIKEQYRDIWKATRETAFGWPYDVAARSALVVSEDERQRVFAEAWEEGAFRMITTFNDLIIDEKANETAAEFIRERIRERVKDPEIAEMLTPRDHPFMTKRPPLENGYYETFNRDNVTLVDVRKAPIQEITPSGIRTADAEYEVDIIVYATGFDAMTGSLFKLGIKGRDGLGLEEKWAEGPRTYLGIATHDFPNLFMITGPQSPSVLSNMPVSIEQHVDWITDCVRHLQANGIDTIEALPAAEDDWLDHHNEVTATTLLPRANSWWVGANIPGKARNLYPYVGGVSTYRAICDQVAASDYDGFALGSGGAPARGEFKGVARDTFNDIMAALTAS